MTGFNDLAQAVAWVFALQKFGIKFGLNSTAALVARLGLPLDRGRFIHIAGTNGKGSVAAMLSAALTRAGYPVALFTSPHLVRFNERFRLRDRDIPDQEVLGLINRVREVVDEAEPPTFFEFVTVMALLYFMNKGASPIILETGMGGRLDATNIVNPILTVITNIAMEHQDYLGETLSQIAGEKAGIIKPGAPLVTYARQKRVLDLFRRSTLKLDVPMYTGGVDFWAHGRGRGRFDYQGLDLTLADLRLSLAGRHQYPNAALALAVLELLDQAGLPVAEEAIREGLAHTRWPGRLEQWAQDRRILLDGAHNPAAARALARALKNSRGAGQNILVLGIMADKDVDAMLNLLLPLGQTAIFTRPAYFRAADPEDLARRAQGFNLKTLVVPKISEAVQQARTLAGPQDHIIITGSLYTVGEAKEFLEGAAGGGG